MVRLVWLLWLLSLPLGAAPLRIGGTLEPPLRYLDPQGRPAGLDVEVIRTLLGRMGVDNHIQLVTSSARLMREAKLGHFDMLLTLSKDPSRLALLSYPQQAHLQIGWYFFVRKEDKARLRFHDYQDLKPWRIGLTQDYVYTPAFLAAVNQPGFRLQTITQNRLQLPKLLAGHIDIVPLNQITALAQIQAQGWQDRLDYLTPPLTRQPYYNPLVLASPYPDKPALLRRYDAELSQMIQDGSLAALYRRYQLTEALP
ncbi:transporter substrate-binding domain-containing protein [Pseudaeromonas sp. ZJS20]|uniref:substrate-binding periplasmic protein n=1 Tax=Pseudaeromonas aegiceratis TaxID=3153928 RepID=UPI00390C71A5